jgi:hypothetical protein
LPASLSLAEKNLRRTLSQTYVPCRKKTDKHTLVGLSRFCVVLFYVKRK